MLQPMLPPLKKQNCAETDHRSSAQTRIAGAADEGQRIDNFLFRILKGVPKTRIYKAIRSGEVRLNGSRTKVSRKLVEGESIRIPPIRTGRGKGQTVIPPGFLESIPVLYEDDHVLIVDKPSGLAVHGGSGMSFGIIEAVRQLRPDIPFIELVHRLDRGTSGCLMLAKSRASLLGLQAQLREQRLVQKCYLALVEGRWKAKRKAIDCPILKTPQKRRAAKMRMASAGQPALSIVSAIELFQTATFIEIELKTGRMHQARIHCANSGHAIAGDEIYAGREFNGMMRKLGLNRIFLHAHKLSVQHPISGRRLNIRAGLPGQLSAVMEKLKL